MITSQIPVKDWYDVIGEKTIADAVLDRIVTVSYTHLSSPKVINAIQRPKYYKNFFC